ncbi:MAG: hypothetical protein FJ404_05215 [Verrucomicrobia bacterium]|nr:hypothetical protein [Verrucomicrobiota bacterium]
MNRRRFLGTAFSAAALGDPKLWPNLPRVCAKEARLPQAWVRFHPDLEPVVHWIENTPRERILGEAVHRIRRGLAYRDLLAGLFLAGIRQVQPRPIGFKFHAVLVVNSAHLASLESGETDRWHPILWALHRFKLSQEADEREGDWALGAVEESKLPPSHLARSAFIEAMERWDESAADAAITALARTAGAHEIFDLLCRFGLRDFREIGHKQIYISNAFRVLDVIGWRHAEPVLRGIVYGLLDTDRDPNPSKSDLPADRPGRRNRERLKDIPDPWLAGRPNDDTSRRILAACRDASAIDLGEIVIQSLRQGSSPASIFDGLHAATAELLLREPGLVSMHAWTTTNAARYAWNRVSHDETRRFMLLQNASFIPLFRGQPKKSTVALDQLPVEPLEESGPEALHKLFEGPIRQPGAAIRLHSWLEAGHDPGAFAATARRFLFAKGTDAHDYKFCSAFLEDYPHIAPRWRNPFLAASILYLRGAQDPDNAVIQQIREALKS